MYAIFLLVLLADVARTYGSTPPAGDAGLILSAASQLQVSPAGGAILALRRSGGSASHIAAFRSFGLRLSGWSRDFSSHSAAVMWPASALLSGAGSVVIPSFPSTSPSLGIFEHSGSPAP
jgi:hypothetical protein